MPEPHVVRRGRGTPLIVLHGNGVDHRLLLSLDHVFADGPWERIFIDLPGFGGTAALTGTGGLIELACWLESAVDALLGEGPFAILANSLGGLLALHLTARLGTRVFGLALIAPVVEPDRARRTLPARTVVERDDAVLASLPPADREAFTDVAVRQTAESWAMFRDHALPGIRAADGEAMARLARHYRLDDGPSLGSLRFEGPTVIVTGRQDHVVGFRDQFELLDRFDAASYVVVDGAGHNVHLEQPDLVDALLREWAHRVVSTGKSAPGAAPGAGTGAATVAVDRAPITADEDVDTGEHRSGNHP
nr:alpha/beta hydrolase [Pseudoclavibacter chungangensis]